MTTIDDPDLAAEVGAAGQRSRRDVLRALVKQPASVASIVFLLLLVVIAVTAGIISPHSPSTQNLSEGFAGISADHWLGTDKLGRDVLSRMLYASRIAILAPLIAVGIAVVLGIPAGLIAGMSKRRLDSIMNTISDTLLSVPGIVMALAIVTVVGPGLVTAMVAIGIVMSPSLFRIVRGAAMVIAEETFIASARSIGSGRIRTMFRHVLPNIAAPVLVQVTLLMAAALLAEAGLSFLGLGVQPPSASWGAMLKSAYENQYAAPWAVVAPGVAIVLTVLSLNTLGDGLRDALAGRKSRD